MRIMQSENFATDIHAHYRQSETAPIYAHYMREKFRPDIYKNCGAFWQVRWVDCSDISALAQIMLVCGGRCMANIVLPLIGARLGL